jgi:hypothetical protein
METESRPYFKVRETCCNRCLPDKWGLSINNWDQFVMYLSQSHMYWCWGEWPFSDSLEALHMQSFVQFPGSSTLNKMTLWCFQPRKLKENTESHLQATFCICPHNTLATGTVFPVCCVPRQPTCGPSYLCSVFFLGGVVLKVSECCEHKGIVVWSTPAASSGRATDRLASTLLCVLLCKIWVS